MQTILYLKKEQFDLQELPLASRGELQASTFRFASGVEALRLKNSRGELVLLPYVGQQIWSARFDGRELTWKSMLGQPNQSRVFLENYGAFLVHCGASAMGVPGPQDTHPLHGELPLAAYTQARLLLGEDAGGAYIGLTGDYEHTVAFNYHYLAQPLVKLYAGKAVFQVSLRVENLKKTRMPLMYLAHTNFRPVDHGRLIYTARPTPQHVRVRASFPSFMTVTPEFQRFVESLVDAPQKHHVFQPGLAYDPELVFFIDYLADEQGWAHTLQVHPDGSADVLRHRPDQLKNCMRWITRTPDQDALGIEPATAEGDGFTAELKKGNLQWLEPGQVFTCDLQVGLLAPDEAAAQAQAIERLLQRAGE